MAHLRIGSVVWVYLDGFPWWPAYVIGEEGAPSTRLVEFFNDNKRVCRAPLVDIVEYNANMNLALQSGSSMRDVLTACQEANTYLALCPNGFQTPSSLDILQLPTDKKRSSGLCLSTRVALAGGEQPLRAVAAELGALKRAVNELRDAIGGDAGRAREAILREARLFELIKEDRKKQRRCISETSEMLKELRIYHEDAVATHKRLLEMQEELTERLKMNCDADTQLLGCDFEQITKDISIEEVIDQGGIDDLLVAPVPHTSLRVEKGS